MKQLLVLAGVAAAALATPTTGARAQGAQVGTLTCSVAAGSGYLFGSQKQVACTFQNTRSQTQVYDGTMSRLGVDIGYTSGSTLVWTVISAGRVAPGALAGSYVGAAAEVTAARGLGANALFGGSNGQIGLQPLSISSQSGLNLAAGAAQLTLYPREVAAPRRR